MGRLLWAWFYSQGTLHVHITVSLEKIAPYLDRETRGHLTILIKFLKDLTFLKINF